MFLKPKLIATLFLVGTSFTPLTQIQAQDCAIDLTDSIIALTQAQADAASGDTSSALASIIRVQAQLDAIQQACGAEAAPENPATDLAETFAEPGMLSVQYPAGWFASEFHTGLDWELTVASTNPLNLPIPPGGTITMTSEEMSPGYSAYAVVEGVQSVTVIVGSPMHLFAELGIYDSELAEEFLAGDFGFEALVDALETRINQSPMASGLQITPLETERPTVSIETEGSDTRLTLVLVALDEAENLYALLVSPTRVKDNSDMLPLLEAMAATVR